MRPPPSVIDYEFGKTPAETSAMARSVKVMLENHTHENLKGPLPSWLTSTQGLGEEADQLDAAALRAASRDIYMLKALEEKHVGVKRKLLKVAQFVELAVDGERAAVKAAGIPVRPLQVVKVIPEIPLPPEFSVFHGESGTIKGKTPRHPRAKSYRLQISEIGPTDEGSWRDYEDFPLASKILITGLEPGKLYWFRLSILTSDGRSQWSAPVSIRCL
jgi:hypothetical protein